MADDQGTNVAPQDQAKANEPDKAAPQDNGSETPAASATPDKPAEKPAEKKADSKKQADTPSDSGRGAGLHR